MGNKKSLSVQKSKLYVPRPYNDPKFINLIRMHRDKCLRSGNFEAFTVPHALALQCRGDFYLLLQKYNVLSKQWYLALLLNGLGSPSDFTGILEGDSILIPKLSFVEGIAKSFSATVDIS